MLMARRRRTGGLITYGVHAGQHTVCSIRISKHLPPLVIVDPVQGLAGLMAANTGLILLFNRITDFRFPIGMDDRTVLADHPEPLDALLLANVLNDLFGDITFVQKHG